MLLIKPGTLSLLALAVTLLLLTPNAFAGQSCYQISNFAVPNYVNITINSIQFMIRLNFIGPNAAGITINDSSSFSLPLNQSVVVLNRTNNTYFSELVNVSWLPVEHTVTINFCDKSTAANAPNTISSTSSLTSTSSSTTAASTFSSSSSIATTILTKSAPVTTSPLGSDSWIIKDAVVAVVAISIIYGLYSLRRKNSI